jgi:hypothetical protein
MTDNEKYFPSEREITTKIYGLFFKPWHEWLNTRLCRWTTSEIRLTRLLDVHKCIVDGIAHKGYKFIIGTDTLRDKLLTWAYVVDREFFYESCPGLVLPLPKHRDTQLDKDEYEYHLDYDFWDNIKKYYDKDNDLFYRENAATFFWANIGVFYYRYLDLVNSRIVHEYDERERLIDEAETEKLISEGVLARDKKGRIVSARQVEDETF